MRRAPAKSWAYQMRKSHVGVAVGATPSEPWRTDEWRELNDAIEARLLRDAIKARLKLDKQATEKCSQQRQISEASGGTS